jgi:homoserine kinase
VRAHDRVAQEQRAEPLPLLRPMHGQPAKNDVQDMAISGSGADKPALGVMTPKAPSGSTAP